MTMRIWHANEQALPPPGTMVNVLERTEDGLHSVQGWLDLSGTWWDRDLEIIQAVVGWAHVGGRTSYCTVNKERVDPATCTNCRYYLGG